MNHLPGQQRFSKQSVFPVTADPTAVLPSVPNQPAGESWIITNVRVIEISDSLHLIPVWKNRDFAYINTKISQASMEQKPPEIPGLSHQYCMIYWNVL